MRDSRSDSSKNQECVRTPARVGFAVVDEKGHLALPERVARRFGITPGEKVYLDVAENSIRLRRPLSTLAKIYVEPTARCNMDCEMCQRRAGLDGQGDMAPGIFRRILEAIGACRPRPTVVLGGLGEPMMHPHLMDFIERCKGLDARVELISNGLLLDSGRAEQLRALGLDRLWLSIDGISGGHRGHSMCREALEERVQTLWKLRTTHQFPSGSGFRVGIVFVAMKSNVHELPEVLDVARRLHADRALISNLLPYSVGMSRESLFCRSLWNVGDSGLQIRMARMDPSGGAAELVAGAMRPQDAIDSAPREYRDPLNTCPFVTAGSMSVRWDGSISPCLPLLRSHVAPIGHLWRRSAECAFGSLRDRGLLEIWELPEFVEFRQRVTRWDFPHCPSCGGCELAEANRTDCLGSPFPTCGGCLWAQGLILCP